MNADITKLLDELSDRCVELNEINTANVLLVLTAARKTHCVGALNKHLETFIAMKVEESRKALDIVTELGYKTPPRN